MDKEEKSPPKGKLIIIGGNEIKERAKSPKGDNNQKSDFYNGVLNEILLEQTIKDPVIEIIPVASEDQDAMGRDYSGAFKKLKQTVNVLFMNTRKDFSDPENLRRIEKANIVFFTGGDQSKLEKLISKTPFLEVLQSKYQNEDFIIAGTSSGAMVWAESMILSGEDDEALLKGVIETKPGLGLISNIIIDTHFLSRGRVSRLAESLLANGSNIGLGICEDTGLVISKGRFLKTIGSGTVVIMEGKNIKTTNYESAKKKEPVFIENLIMHILAPGAGYDLKQQRFLILDKKEMATKEMQRA